MRKTKNIFGGQGQGRFGENQAEKGYKKLEKIQKQNNYDYTNNNKQKKQKQNIGKKVERQ